MKHARHDGFALLAGLILLVTLSAGVITHALNQRLGTRADIRDKRELIRGMRDAQLALIAHALIEDNTPGTLPAPSGENALNGRSNPVGYAGSPAQAARRLPWHFLALSPYVAGECLWYAVATNYRNNTPTSQRNGHAETSINPSSTGTLSVTTAADTAPIAAVAALFAPGRIVDVQSGRQAQSGMLCAGGEVASFLEGENASPSATFFDAAADSRTNDTVMAVTSAQLMQPVLRRVLSTFSSESIRAGLLSALANAPQQGTLDALRCAFSSSSSASCPGRESFDTLIANTTPDHLSYSGNCPGRNQSGAATDYKHPVSWLCFNDWYAHIRYDQPSSQLSIAIPETGYQCALSLTTGHALCSR